MKVIAPPLLLLLPILSLLLYSCSLCITATNINGNNNNIINNNENIGMSMETAGRSCQDIFQEGKEEAGVYWIKPYNEPFQVYCKQGWTLIESFSVKNANLFKKGFTVKETGLNTDVAKENIFENYRISFPNLVELKKISTDLKMTCNNQFDSGKDVALAKIRNFDIFLEGSKCISMEYINVRGASCSNCRVQWHQNENKHFYIDTSRDQDVFCNELGDSKDGLDTTASEYGKVIDGEQSFGNYEIMNPEFSCTLSPDSTTQYWVKSINCEEADDEVACESNLKECFGIPETNKKVCSGRGKCVGYNNCFCDPSYAGVNCELEICGGNASEDVKGCSPKNPLTSCKDARGKSGLYYIALNSSYPFLAYCGISSSSKDSISKDDVINMHINTSSPNSNSGKFEISVSKHDMLTYNFMPKVISENKIVFLDAQDLNYYERDLKNPIMTIWLLNQRDPKENKRKVNYTAKRLFETAWKMNIQIRIVEVGKFDLFVSPQDGLEHIFYNGEKVTKFPDVLLPRLGARISYYGLALVRQFEKMGVLVLNSHDSLETSKDKLFTLQQLRSNNFPIPKTMIAKFPLNDSLISKEFSYPLVMKQISGSQGEGVILIKDAEHLKEITAMVDTTRPLLLQEFIADSKGRDIRVIVVGGKAIGAMMRIAKSGWKSNFHLGGYVQPLKLSPSVEWLAIEAARVIGLDIAGVDILISKNEYKVNEINSTPGFQGFEMATGVDVAEKIISFAKLKKGIFTKTVKKRKTLMIPVDADIILAEKPVEMTKAD